MLSHRVSHITGSQLTLVELTGGQTTRFDNFRRCACCLTFGPEVLFVKVRDDLRFVVFKLLSQFEHLPTVDWVTAAWGTVSNKGLRYRRLFNHWTRDLLENVFSHHVLVERVLVVVELLLRVEIALREEHHLIAVFYLLLGDMVDLLTLIERAQIVQVLFELGFEIVVCGLLG